MISFPYRSGAVRVTSPYGERVLNGEHQFHSGLDLVNDVDKTVICPVEGYVVQSRQLPKYLEDGSLNPNRTWEWGLYVSVQGVDGRMYYFCHLSSSNVKQWQTVKVGDVIGREGSTGYSFGSHLHFEVRDADGKAMNPCFLLGIANAAGKYTLDKEEKTVNKDDAKKLTEKNGAEEYSVSHVVWALENGILFGDGKGNLALKDPITREQAITMIHRACEYILKQSEADMR